MIREDFKDLDSACLALTTVGSLKERCLILFVHFSSTFLMLGVHIVLSDRSTSCFSLSYALALGPKSLSSFFLDNSHYGALNVRSLHCSQGTLNRQRVIRILFFNTFPSPLIKPIVFQLWPVMILLISCIFQSFILCSIFLYSWMFVVSETHKLFPLSEVNPTVELCDSPVGYLFRCFTSLSFVP